MDELSVVNFTNIDNQPFDGMWGGVITVINAGETRQFPKFLAEHYCKHLVNKILIKGGQDWSNQISREPLEKRILGQVSVSPNVEKQEEKKEEETFAGLPKDTPKVEVNPLKCSKCDFVGKTKAGLSIHTKKHK
jgi:hypothetical protein